jgi:hypothetical protein
MAEDYGFSSVPSPGGGCLLTDPGYANRLRVLRDTGLLTGENARMIRTGRMFLLDGAIGLVGRSSDENDRMLEAGTGIQLDIHNIPGPLGVLIGRETRKNLVTLTAIMASYTKTTEPVTAFSACFGEAFLPLPPTQYAHLLGEKIDEHNVNVYLVNTGLNGQGDRMSIKDTRACINGILNGSINNAEFETLPVFDLQVPKTLEGVRDNAILNPKNTWDDEVKYNETLRDLGAKFIENFKRYDDSGSEFDCSLAGPQL